MTAIDERAARQREGRTHSHIWCSACQRTITEDEPGGVHAQHDPNWNPIGDTVRPGCTDDHDPIETALDALALAWDVVPADHPQRRAIHHAIDRAYALLADGGE